MSGKGEREVSGGVAKLGELRVLLLPTTRRDGDAIREVLEGASIGCAAFSRMEEMCAALGEGAGAVIVSEEAITRDGHLLGQCVAAQPVWGDLPILVMSRSGTESPRFTESLRGLGNVSVVERPVRISTLLSLVRSALRARGRQYEVAARLDEVAKAEALVRESENRLRLIADSIPNLAWSARPDGHIYWYNRRWYEYTGTTPEQMEGWGWQSVHEPKSLPAVLERWRACLQSGDEFQRAN